MLTKDLLIFRTRKGAVFPKRIATDDQALPLAQALVQRMNDGVGEPKGVVEADLTALANGHHQPRVAKGLVKLLTDRATFDEPEAEAPQRRSEWLLSAQSVREALTPSATFETYETALGAALGDLDDVRERLYADLPERRALTGFKSIDGPQLLARYDLAQVQGLLLHADRLVLTVVDGDTPELRRVLRWMRFCRLVADVASNGGAWSLTIEGPAAVLEGAKKYGLKLATFFLVVPTLERWSARAEIKMPRRSPLQLQLDQNMGLRPGLEGGAGHVPPEMRAVLDGWTDEHWKLDANPAPKAMGVSGWCVPDLAAQRGEQTVAVELFHAWHHGALPRRLAELAVRPEPNLLLGVDRKLVARTQTEVTGPQMFEFSGFVTRRGLKRALTEWWSSYGKK